MCECFGKKLFTEALISKFWENPYTANTGCDGTIEGLYTESSDGFST